MPPFSNEIFGMFVESLGEDMCTLRVCSLVSSVFRHFCSPILYRDIVLDRKGKVDTFIRMGGRSNSLQHTKSFSLTYNGFETKAHLGKLRRILDIISRKASLQTLHLHRVQFHTELLSASLFSKLSGVIVMVLQECHFGGFEDFVSFIRCFPRCEVLRLHGCGWIRNGEHVKLKFRGLPAYDLALVHLEITDTIIAEWGEEFCDQGKIVGMVWLKLTGLKSFTYVIGDQTAWGAVLEMISACELLEEIDVTLVYPGGHSFGERKNRLILTLSNHLRSARSTITQLTPFIARIKSLTLRCFVGFLPWRLSFAHSTGFPSSLTLERVRIITPGPFPMTEGCEILDATFSDTEKYPSLKELEVCSFLVTQARKSGRDTYERLSMDEHLPRLKAMGRLPA